MALINQFTLIQFDMAEKANAPPMKMAVEITFREINNFEAWLEPNTHELPAKMLTVHMFVYGLG